MAITADDFNRDGNPDLSTVDGTNNQVVVVANQRTGEVLSVYPDILDDLDQHPQRLDIAASAARLSIPWLIVHGEVDETVPITEGKALHAAAPGATFLPVPRTGHTFGAIHPLAGWAAPLVQVVDASVEFLGRHLP